ncbi:MAG: PAS domain-containing protein [Myxococcota bacterium]
MSGGASLLSFLDTPVVVGDPDGRVIYVNPTFEQSFEQTGREVQGELLASLFTGGAREAMLGAVAEVCGSGRTQRFRLREAGRGYLALVSPIVGDGQQLGVIILLTDEPLADERVLAFHREMQEPLEELRASLDELLEQTGGRRNEQHRLAVEGGLRALERARKWSDELHGLLSGRGASLGLASTLDAVALVRQVISRVAPVAEASGAKLELLVPAQLQPAIGDASRLEAALVHVLKARLSEAPSGAAFTVSARASGQGEAARVVLSLVEPAGASAQAGDDGFMRDTVEALGGGVLCIDLPDLGRVTTIDLPCGAA